jgi:hypothetical protein
VQCRAEKTDKKLYYENVLLCLRKINKKKKIDNIIELYAKQSLLYKSSIWRRGNLIVYICHKLSIQTSKKKNVSIMLQHLTRGLIFILFFFYFYILLAHRYMNPYNSVSTARHKQELKSLDLSITMEIGC